MILLSLIKTWLPPLTNTTDKKRKNPNQETTVAGMSDTHVPLKSAVSD